MTANQDRSVLVTGASGFVGRYVIDALVAAGYAVAGTGPTPRPDGLQKAVAWFDVNLCDAESLRTLPRQWWGVIHLAARSIPQSFAGTADVFENVIMTIDLTEHLQGSRFLYVSSSHVYQSSANPLTEHSPERPAGRYGLSKLLGEHVLIARQHLFDVRIARPFNHIGVGMRPELVVPSIIRRIQQERDASAPLQMLGKNSIRDFVDVRDVADAYRRIIALDAPVERTFNVCSGRPVSIRDIAETVLEISGRKRPVEFADSQLSTDDTDIMVGDARLLHEATGWKPRYSPYASLSEMYHSYTSSRGPAEPMP